MARITQAIGRGAAIAVAVGIGASSAMAGGFFVREQGALGQGASFAGAGASTALSAMFMNSAAVTSLDGMNSDASLSVILPEAKFTATSSSFPTANQTTDIGINAYVPASYVNYQFKHDPKMYIGLGVNSPFGLKTEPDQPWAGSTVGASSRLFTVNFNPTLGYKFSEKLSVGVGAQFEYAKGVFKFATLAPTRASTFYEGDSLAVGATAGLMYTPTPSTRIGLGWRSQMTHELDGRFASDASVSGGFFAAGVSAKVDLRLPDIVNLSLVQAITPNMRLLATVEWTDWSRFGGLEVIQDSTGRVVTKGGAVTGAGTSVAQISGKWEDGYFFSGGLEYDVNKQLTVRAGGAYEISPITKATERITSIPDADRIWASIGFSYNVNAATTVDFGYSHVFVEAAQVDRWNVTNTNFIKADLDASVDIISLGMRMKLN
ncbi:MAG: OmpP1/FadL family transporter [Hyphomicrobiaceae bacterium]